MLESFHKYIRIILMKNALDTIDLDIFTPYTIKIKVIDTYDFPELKEGAKTEDEDGQSLDPTSDVRRTIKYSFPCENKKIISTIKLYDEIEDEHAELCRNIELEYHLLFQTQSMDDFSLEELHDEIEEVWRNGSAGCEITISPYN